MITQVIGRSGRGGEEGRAIVQTFQPEHPVIRAIIAGDTAGFIKLISDPATHVVLGGTVVGHHASELIAPIAMDEGLRFAIREGGRTVGAGRVTKIIE